MKAILIIDESLSAGVAANAAAILAMTLGRRAPELLGDDVRDASGEVHAGITRLPLPIIGASAAAIKLIRRSLRSPEYRDEIVVGFTRTAQGCRSYEEYVGKMAQMPFEDLEYLGIGLYGRPGKINQLTGGLKLFGRAAEPAMAA